MYLYVLFYARLFYCFQINFSAAGTITFCVVLVLYCVVLSTVLYERILQDNITSLTVSKQALHTLY